jgi:lipoate-protein ligase A
MIADREWRFIPEQSRPGPMQMALEEVAAETAAGGGPRTVRVYRWQPSTLSLGYRQAPETVDWGFCDREGVAVTRRQTGGGGIYHDSSGDLSYSIVAPESELPGDLLDCYELLCEPILDAFDRMGIDAAFAADTLPTIYQPACYLREIHPAHDVLAAGQKISGNAQYRQRDAVIQHGSLSYHLRPETHLGVFETAVTEVAYRDRVPSIRDQAGLDRAQAVETLEEALREWADATPGAWTDAELDRAREIAAEKYDTDRWTRQREDPLSAQ